VAPLENQRVTEKQLSFFMSENGRKWLENKGWFSKKFYPKWQQ